MKSVSLCLVIFFAGISLLAQTKAAAPTQGLLIKLNPLSLFDPRYPTLQAGVEGNYKRVGFSYTFGSAINTFLWKKEEVGGALLAYKGHKHKLSGQYLMKHRLIGIEYFKTAFQKERENGKYPVGAGDGYYTYDYVKQKVEAWGIALKAGLTHRLNERFVIVYTNSLGIRKQTIRYTEGRNLQVHPENDRHRWWGANVDAEGTKSHPHFAIELSIGYKLF